MKVQKFLNEINKLLQNSTEVHLTTFKKIVVLFYEHLSKKEQNRWKYDINVITSFTNVQQTIEQNLSMNEVKELKKELNRIKGK